MIASRPAEADPKEFEDLLQAYGLAEGEERDSLRQSLYRMAGLDQIIESRSAQNSSDFCLP